MSDETIYEHGDTRIDVGSLTGDLRVFDKGDLMAIIEDGGYTEEAIRSLRAEVERLHGLVAAARNWIDPEEHEAWEEQAGEEANSCASIIESLRAEVKRLQASNDFLRHCTQGFVFISEHGEMETWVCADCRGKNWRDDYGVWITDKQIDAAWKWRNESGLHRDSLLLGKLGIVECQECGGYGSLVYPSTAITGGMGGQMLTEGPCVRCHGHGWIREEHGDE